MSLRWSKLRPIGNSWPARLTVLIPLVGYLIIFNTKLAGYADLIREVSGGDPVGLSVSPRLFQVNFGLCFVSIGAAIYAFACPSIVKKYGTSGAFAGGDGQYYGNFGIDLIRQTLTSEGYAAAVEEIRRRYDPLPDTSGRPPSDADTYQVRNAILHLYFTYLNGSGPLWCWLSAFFYVLGFVVLLVPSIKIFSRVVRILFDLTVTYGLWSLF